MIDKNDVPPNVDQQPDVPEQEVALSGRWRAVRSGAGLYLFGMYWLILSMTDLPQSQPGLCFGLTLVVVGLLFSLGPMFFSWCIREMGCNCPESNTTPFVVVSALLGVGGLICLGTGGLTFDGTLAQENAANVAQDTPSDWTDHGFGKGRFSVQTPESWQPAEGHVEHRDVCLTDPATGLQFMALFRAKDGTAVTGTTEFAEFRLEQLGRINADMQADEPRISHVGGVRVVDVTVTRRSDGDDTVCHLRYLESGDAWGELTIWTSPTTYVQQQEAVMRVLNSARVRQSRPSHQTMGEVFGGGLSG